MGGGRSWGGVGGGMKGSLWRISKVFFFEGWGFFGGWIVDIGIWVLGWGADFLGYPLFPLDEKMLMEIGRLGSARSGTPMVRFMMGGWRMGC